MASFPKGHPLGALALTSKFGVTRSTRSGHHLPWPLFTHPRKEILKKPTPYTKNGHTIRQTPLQRQLNQVFRPCPHPYILLKFHRKTLYPSRTPFLSTQHHGHHPNINRSLIEAMCVFSCGHLTSDFHWFPSIRHSWTGYSWKSCKWATLDSICCLSGDLKHIVVLNFLVSLKQDLLSCTKLWSPTSFNP
jgi:hypothetical protein